MSEEFEYLEVLIWKSEAKVLGATYIRNGQRQDAPNGATAIGQMWNGRVGKENLQSVLTPMKSPSVIGVSWVRASRYNGFR